MSEKIVLKRDPYDNDVVHVYTYEENQVPWYAFTIFHEQVRKIFGNKVYDYLFNSIENTSTVSINISVTIINDL